MLDNYQFHYSLVGCSHQPPILFLHGFMGNTHEFAHVISLLCQDFRCLSVDLPGHGKTQVFGGDQCYTIANTADGLMSLLDTLKISQCFLVGYSMGGRLALYLTLHFPHRFPKVVLESASPGLVTEVERLERIKRDQQIAKQLRASDFAVFLTHWYGQSIFGDIKNHFEFDQLIKNRLQNQPRELAKSLQFMGTGCQPSLWEKLQENTNSLLLLVGEYDEKFIAINAAVEQMCQFCQLRVISHCGHNTHFENPLAFVENVKDFLRSS